MKNQVPITHGPRLRYGRSRADVTRHDREPSRPYTVVLAYALRATCNLQLAPVWLLVRPVPGIEVGL